MQDLASAVSAFATKRQFKKQSVLLYQGEVPRMGYVIKSGLVKMYNISDAGDEQIVGFHGPNDHFPSSWVFKKSRTTFYYYETLTECEILTMTRDSLQEILFKPEYVNNTLNYYISVYNSTLMRVTALGQSRAKEKILFTFYYLLYRYSQPCGGGKYQVNLPLTHQVLASLVGLTRETISHEINRLKRMNVLDYQDRIYIVDKKLLERALGEDSFQGLLPEESFKNLSQP